MGRHFGRYEIRDEGQDLLGHGGFGWVYRAFDPMMDRYVAVKILAAGSDEEMIRRFRDELKTTCLLKHENIVDVYDSGLQDGLPYLVMELLEGQTLDKIITTRTLADRPVEFLDKVEIIYQVARGLQYAHERVIHRDIKPSNIMVLPTGVAKILDFGIARVVDKDTRWTREGSIAGTIQYMAPEQFDGQADRLTDVFAYGGLCYELLTGVHPFAADDLRTVVYRVTSIDPAPIRSLLPDCPEGLASMIAGLLIKDRERRTGRMQDVVRATQPILIGLRQKRAAEIVAGIGPLLERGQVEQADAAAGRAFDLDPVNPSIQAWRETIAERLQQKARQTRAQTRIREARDHVAARRFEAALQSMESALGQDPSNTQIRAEWEALKTRLARTKEAVRLAGEAAAQLARGEIDGALVLSRQALDLDPGNAEAARVAEDARGRARTRLEAQEIGRADSLRLAGNYAAALEILDRLAADGMSGPKVAALRALVERDRAEAERQKRAARFRTALDSARDLLVSQRLDEAEAAALSVCREFPEQREAEEFLARVREHQAAQKRMDDVGAISQMVRSMIAANQFDDAQKLLEDGLKTYRGDSTLIRLMEMVKTLQEDRRRVLEVDSIVRSARELTAAGRLDEALRLVDAALAKYGQESKLLGQRRSIEYEKEHQERQRAIQEGLAEARRLLSAGRPKEAVELLEAAAFRDPGDREVKTLLSSARLELAAALEREFASSELARAASLEGSQQITAALAIVVAALERFQNNADLRVAAARLRQKQRDQQREQAIQAHIRKMEDSMRLGQWDAAAASLEEAQKEFPQNSPWAPLAVRIQDGRKRESLQLLDTRVTESFARWDLEDAERQLAAAQSLSGEPGWQALRRQLDLRHAYQDRLEAAEDARCAGKFERAEGLLLPILATAPDGRAEALRQRIVAQRREAEEAIRQDAQSRMMRDAEERARTERERAISAGRQEAAAALRTGDVQTAVAVLRRLARQFEDNQDIRRELEAAERLQHDRYREEEARAEAEMRAVSEGRQRAAGLAGRGDPAGALALLDALARQYPERPEISADQVAIRTDAEERRRRYFAERRDAAARLADAQKFPEALAIFDALAALYPERPEIGADRAAAIRLWERQRREEDEAAQRRRDDEAVSRGCAEAAALVRAGECRQAIQKLDELANRYPGYPMIAVERQKAVLAGEQQMREDQERARIASGRAEAARFFSEGDVTSAIAVLDRLLAEFGHSTQLQIDRAAMGVEAERQNRERQEKASRVLQTRTAPEPRPEDRAKKALKNTTASMRALKIRHWYTPIVELLAAIWSFLVGVAARIVVFSYVAVEKMLPGKRIKAGLRDRFAKAALAWAAQQAPGNSAVESAQDRLLQEMVRGHRNSEEVSALSRGDIAILAAIAGILLLLVAGVLGFFYVSSRVEVVAAPSTLTFQYKMGASDRPQDVILPKNLDYSVTADSWISATKSPEGLTVKIVDTGLAPRGYEGSIQIKPHSWRAKNTVALVAVKLTILPPMRVSPDKVTFYNSGILYREFQVTGTARFSVVRNQPWVGLSQHGQTLIVSVDASQKGLGTHKATVTVTDLENGATIQIPVTLQVLG